MKSLRNTDLFVIVIQTYQVDLLAQNKTKRHVSGLRVERKCKNWLLTLYDYAEDTESPRDFWMWSGLFCITAALQRKVWLPFGMSRTYPNLYVMIIAPPGWCRKSVPVGFAKKILQSIELPVYVDAPTKRAFTKKLDSLSRLHSFEIMTPEGIKVTQPQSPISCISKELSSFLAQDPKAMVEILTDIYDPHDKWEYETAGSGEDTIIAPCVGTLLASTPMWIAANLPPEAIGGGFTRRFVIVSGTERYKELSYPPIPPEKLFRALQEDLAHIATLVGEFKWEGGQEGDAFRYYDVWYKSLTQKVKTIQDERVQPFLSEVHTIALKTVMALQVASSDELVIREREMRQSIALLEKIIATAGTAFGSHGRSRNAIDTDRIMLQLATFPKIDFSDLLRMNYKNTNRVELNEVLENLEGMRRIKRVMDIKTGRQTIHWLGIKELKEEG